MRRTRLSPEHDGVLLAADRRPGSGDTRVLLHAGVADRRGWHATADLTGTAHLPYREDPAADELVREAVHGSAPPQPA